MKEAVTFLITVVAVLATPGPTNTLLMTSGATTGARALRLIPAEISGYLISILTIGYVIAPWISGSHAITLILRLAVAAYLLFLAVRLWRSPVSMTVHQRLIRFSDVFVTTLLNPKALLFAMGIIPLQSPEVVTYLSSFCGLVAIIGSAWILIGVIAANGLAVKARAALPRIGAVVIAVFAAYLVFQR